MKRLILLVLLVPLAGCLPIILEWHNVGVYGDPLTSVKVLQECRDMLREKGWAVQTYDVRAMRLETRFRDFKGMGSGLRQQIRVRLIEQEGSIYIFVMGIKNENVGDFNMYAPGSAAWGPDEQDRVLERQVHFMITRRLEKISKNP